MATEENICLPSKCTDEYSDNTSIENAYDLLNDISELQVMEDNEDLEDRLSEYNKREMINNRFFTL